MNSLQKKLSITLFLLLLVIGAITWSLAQHTANRYSLELYQRLNTPITMYMSEQTSFFDGKQANHEALARLADLVMVVNPSLEVYLLDADGNIISHAFDESIPVSSSVQLAPIQKFLGNPNQALILGDDPRAPDTPNIFSAHPLIENGSLKGYLYVILAGQTFQSLLSDVKHSHTLYNAMFLLLCCLVFALISGVAAFYFLTRRLRNFTQAVRNVDSNTSISLPSGVHTNMQSPDEIDCLAHAFNELLEKNARQYALLEQADSNRRELIANISHDLRTPLTSLRGYIETMLLQHETLSEDQKQQFLEIAFKQSQRLGQLVAELFELAKLDNGSTQVHVEAFSLLELVYDLAQDFRLETHEKKQHIEVQCDQDDVVISVDIRLIQRVFENLLSNAMRYTPEGGKIRILLQSAHSENVMVRVENEGASIPESEREYIFQRYYRAHNPKEDLKSNAQHSGIGLAIVHKILSLHECSIRLCDETRDGTAFEFNLPLCA